MKEFRSEEAKEGFACRSLGEGRSALLAIGLAKV